MKTVIFPVFRAKGCIKNVSFYHQEDEHLAIITDDARIGRVLKHTERLSILPIMQYLNLINITLHYNIRITNNGHKPQI